MNVSASSAHASIYWPQAKQAHIRLHYRRIRQYFRDATIEVSSAAGAQDEEPAPITFVTGAGTEVNQYGSSEEDEGDLSVADIRGYEVMTQSAPLGQVVEWSDPRLEGRVRRIAEASVVTGPGLGDLASACAEDSDCDEPFLNAQIRVLSIENDEGAWRERPRFLLSFPGSAYAMPFPAAWEMVLDGEGAYDGLVAVLQATDSETGGQTYHGFIIDVELLPPTPANAAAE